MIARVGGEPCRLIDFVALGNREPRSDFVNELLNRTNYDRAVGFTSGRGALVAALKLSGIEQNDEVLIPAHTCHSVDAAVSAVATPVYVDVASDLCIDPESAAEKVSRDTAAIVPVHMFGQPADTGAINNLAKEYDLTIIEDAAHALGTTHISDTVGSIGDYCFFSFRFSKEVTVMNGGVLLTNSDVSALEESQRPSRLWPVELGTVVVGEYIRGRLPGNLFKRVQQEILTPFFTSSSASLGETAPVQMTNHMRIFLTEQDAKLADQVRARRQNAALYDDLLPNVDRPDRSPDHSFYRYPILINEDRDEFATELQRAGVGCSRMYSYVLSPRGLCPTAEFFSNRIVNLPVHASVNELEIREITSIVRDRLGSDERSS